MASIQQSKLLASLFERFDPEQRLTVLHIGGAMPETVDFFSHYRSKLYFVDLFAELPFEEPEDGPDLAQQFSRQLPDHDRTRFDICLFWDLFNYLSRDAIEALSDTLQPYLHPASLGHGFSVHNLRSPPGNQLYAISERDALAVRTRAVALPGYAPHAQGHLQQMLHCFKLERSVLLPDSRLELLLSART